jgi:type II secretory pathway component PulK
MPNRSFNLPKSKSTAKGVKIADTIDVAARYSLYKLYEAVDGQPKVLRTLCGMNESRATIAGRLSADESAMRGRTASPP